MSARSASFRQADLARAIKAMVRAGLEIGPVEIDLSGKIVIMPAKKGQSEPNGTTCSNEAARAKPFPWCHAGL
jgi:hypothetical protein